MNEHDNNGNTSKKRSQKCHFKVFLSGEKNMSMTVGERLWWNIGFVVVL